MALAQATAIYRNGRYTFNESDNTIDLNSPKIDAYSPRNAWVLRTLVPGQNQIQYNITFAPTSADLADANTVAGLYVEQDGKGVVIDCISISAFNDALNNGTTIQRRYGAAPAFTTPSPSWWCVTRSDDGSGAAHNDVVMDYTGQYIGNVRLKSNTSGTSIYTFQAYGTVVAVGSDTVATC